MTSTVPSGTDDRLAAFYYPGHLWHSGDWIKNLLVFFDSVALLTPVYKTHEPERVEPELAIPLRERGILHYLVAEEAVDRAATEQLVAAVRAVLDTGKLDKLAKQETSFHTISASRVGFYGHRELAQALLDDLKKRGLAKESRDGFSFPMHPLVRALILTLLSQILRTKGGDLGLDLSPVTDRRDLAAALGELLGLRSQADPGAVVSLDMRTVGVDLSHVPLDEVLSFRDQYALPFRAYARDVRDFACRISPLPDSDRKQALADREEELKDRAIQLQHVSTQAWRQPLSLALGFLGAAWTYTTGDPIGALVAACSGLIGVGGSAPQVDAYTYLFSLPHSLPDA
jgi:hypothetical protein